MLKIILVISIILNVMLIGIIAVIAVFVPWQQRTSPVPGQAPQPTLTSVPAPTVVPVPKPTTPVLPGAVKFGFAITEITGTGLSRTITAQITNTGTADAHNAWAKVEASSGGARVALNGQDSLRVDVGTVKAGESVAKQVTLNFSIADGLKVMNSGAIFILTVYSDEYTETFSYDYKP